MCIGPLSRLVPAERRCEVVAARDRQGRSHQHHGGRCHAVRRPARHDAAQGVSQVVGGEGGGGGAVVAPVHRHRVVHALTEHE
eukprot:scaffold71162_cov73-Phaeocystis_antarctica.AAC.5